MTKQQFNEDNVRSAALDTLVNIEKQSSYSNLVLNKVLDEVNLNDKDKRLLTELVYGTIQRRATIDEILNGMISMKKTPQWVIVLLRLSLYQLLYLDRVPEHAIVNEAVEIAKKRSDDRFSSFVNGVLRTVIRNKPKLQKKNGTFEERLAFETSHPEWLITYFKETYGEEITREICKANLRPPHQTARVNLTQITSKELVSLLREEGFEVVPSEIIPECIINMGGNLAHSKYHEKGFFTIQDESSMVVAYALNPQKDDLVLDCCAAPGGKTTHIAERKQNQGKVISQDLHKHKIKLINQACNRLHLTNVEVKQGNAKVLDQDYSEETFDRILVDAPCSGFGVIRRKPEIKDGKSMSDVASLQKTQYEILNSAAHLLKKGGTLVYSTCTIGSKENEEIVAQFLMDHSDFEKDSTLHDRLPTQLLESRTQKMGELVILPQDFESDGFYICALRKKGE